LETVDRIISGLQHRSDAHGEPFERVALAAKQNQDARQESEDSRHA
jgi:hypothetical protein